MATLQMSENSKAANGRTKKTLPNVDLTAMVDLAFLLITFFMLTTSLSKPYQMDVAKPVDAPEPSAYPASRSMTILLGKNNKAIYYMGEAKNAVMNVVDLKNINEKLIAAKSLVAKTHQLEKDKVMLVIIKPTNGSKYKDLVDILDEMKISSVLSYAIDDDLILDEEQKFMTAKLL